MNHRPTMLRRNMLALCAAGACLFSVPALAADAGMADAMAQYRADIERCNRGDTNQDVATCKREAGAALEEARRQRLMRNGGSYEQNATARCDALPAGQREDCMLQMQVSGGSETLPDGRRVTTTTQGSIAQGGVIRQTEIVTPGETTVTTTYTTPATASPNAGAITNPVPPAPSLR